MGKRDVVWVKRGGASRARLSGACIFGMRNASKNQEILIPLSGPPIYADEHDARTTGMAMWRRACGRIGDDVF
ncbi:hypothetical protein C6Q17_20925 [Burkholderia contaminans]|nr:hypothetical protein C6Q17_20925 [Burkholderia contaminans]